MPILLIGPLTHEIPTGLSLAFESLVKGFQENHRPYRIVDLRGKSRPYKPGAMSIIRIAQVLPVMILIMKRVLGCSGVYLTISDSRNGFLRDFFTIWYSILFRKKIILHLHSGGYSDFYHSIPAIYQQIVRITLSQASAIITLSDSVKEQFTFLPNHRHLTVVIHNGLPIDLPVKQFKLSSSFPKVTKDVFNVLYLSNMIKRKGYLDVLAAAHHIVSAGHQDIRFHFCGEFLDDLHDSEETNKQKFYSYIDQKGIKPFVFYHGVVRGEKKAAILANSHILVLPARQSEGQPLCIIEAMANSLPVISTAWHGITDLVKNNKTGYLLKTVDPLTIAEKIIALKNDKHLYKKMSEQGQNEYLLKFSRKRHLKNIFELFDSTFSKNHAD